MRVSEQVERSTVNAADAIRRAIGELDAQRMLLTGVLESLDGSNGHGPPKVVKPKTAKARTRGKVTRSGRLPRGERHRQVVEFVTRNQGHTVPEVAKAIGVNDVQVYGIVRRAEANGELRGERRPGEPVRLFPAR